MVIEQYTIATTPKYNFPHPTIDTILPQRFVQQSISSLTRPRNQPFQLNLGSLQQASIIEPVPVAFQLKMPPSLLKPTHEKTPTAACDTSTMKIGETSTGILIAVRGANICKQHKNYTYTRFGPFIFHITEENRKQVYDALEGAYSALECKQSRSGCPNVSQIPTRIASLLERWLQDHLSRTISDGLVLFDGSLTAGTLDTPIERLKGILSSARRRGNVVLAFSKMTNLRINGHLITEVPLQQKTPYLLETIGLRPKPPIVLLGEVYVVRLSYENYAFRLDIDKENSYEQRIEAVERLLGNDALSQGYPETLRLAHILCTFTANEVIAMRHYAATKCGLNIINRPDIHRLLFGPYGRGEPCS
jgi:hypothetical protein